MTTGKPPLADSPGARRRRPSPTIDLQATEIAVDPAPVTMKPETQPEAQPATPTAAEPQAEAAAQGEQRAEPQAESPQTADDAAGAGQVPPPPPPPPRRPNVAWLPPGFPWPLVGAGVVGGAGVVLAFLVLWLLLPGRDAEGVLTPRLASIETQLRELNARPAPVSADPRAIDELSARLARIESAAPARQPATDPALLGRLTAADNTMRSLADNVTALGRRTDEIATAVREARNRGETSAATLAELQGVARTSSADHAQLEALATRIAALERTNQTLADELAKRHAAAANDRAVRFAVATAALRNAVERGDPFVGELAIAKPLAVEGTALAALEPFANSGVPSNASLGRELAALIQPMLKASGVTPREGGFLDRLQTNAEKLVRIRPIDDAPGDKPDAILARIEHRAAQADIDGALSELAKLPAAAREPAQTWIAKAQARGKAVEASRKLAADSVAALKTTP